MRGLHTPFRPADLAGNSGLSPEPYAAHSKSRVCRPRASVVHSTVYLRSLTSWQCAPSRIGRLGKAMRYYGCVFWLLAALSGCATVGPPPMVYQNPVLAPPIDRDVFWDQLVAVVDNYFDIEREDRVRLVNNMPTLGRIDTVLLNLATLLEPYAQDSVGFPRATGIDFPDDSSSGPHSGGAYRERLSGRDCRLQAARRPAKTGPLECRKRDVPQRRLARSLQRSNARADDHP